MIYRAKFYFNKLKTPRILKIQCYKLFKEYTTCNMDSITEKKGILKIFILKHSLKILFEILLEYLSLYDWIPLG